jgi:hypothetical protein
MRIKSEHVFHPQEVGEEGDQIILRISPCCSTCFPTVRVLRDATLCLRASVKNNNGVPCTVLNRYHLPAKVTQLLNGDFQCSIDYCELLPHAPDSPLLISLWLDKKEHCPEAIAIQAILALPVGVDRILGGFLGTALSATEALDTTRFGLQPVHCDC